MYKISITELRELISYLERVNSILEKKSNDPELKAVIDANDLKIDDIMCHFNLTKDEEGRIS